MAVCGNSRVAQPDGHTFEFTVRSYDELPYGQPVVSNTFLCDGDTWQMTVTKLDKVFEVVVRMHLLTRSNTNDSTRMARISYWINNNSNASKVALINKSEEQNKQCGKDHSCVSLKSPLVKDLKLVVTLLKGLEASEVKPVATVKPKTMENVSTFGS